MSLLEFYRIKVYSSDEDKYDDSFDSASDTTSVRADKHQRHGLESVENNMDTCMEELAISWGLDWVRIGGLDLPSHPDDHSSTTGSETPTEYNSGPPPGW